MAIRMTLVTDIRRSLTRHLAHADIALTPTSWTGWSALVSRVGQRVVGPFRFALMELKEPCSRGGEGAIFSPQGRSDSWTFPIHQRNLAYEAGYGLGTGHRRTLVAPTRDLERVMGRSTGSDGRTMKKNRRTTRRREAVDHDLSAGGVGNVAPDVDRGGAQAVSTPSFAPSSGLSERLFRDWSTEYEGHVIRVERRGLRVRLVINGQVRDARFILPGRDSAMPILSAHLDCSRADVVVVEAYLNGLRLKLMARGRPIGGDGA